MTVRSDVFRAAAMLAALALVVAVALLMPQTAGA